MFYYDRRRVEPWPLHARSLTCARLEAPELPSVEGSVRVRAQPVDIAVHQLAHGVAASDRQLPALRWPGDAVTIVAGGGDQTLELDGVVLAVLSVLHFQARDCSQTLISSCATRFWVAAWDGLLGFRQDLFWAREGGGFKSMDVISNWMLEP